MHFWTDFFRIDTIVQMNLHFKAKKDFSLQSIPNKTLCQNQDVWLENLGLLPNKDILYVLATLRFFLNFTCYLFVYKTYINTIKTDKNEPVSKVRQVV